MAQATGTSATTVVISNASTANTDTFCAANTGLDENDDGGTKTVLWSRDDEATADSEYTTQGGISFPTDLLDRNLAGWSTQALGSKIWITADGKVAYQLTDALSRTAAIAG